MQYYLPKELTEKMHQYFSATISKIDELKIRFPTKLKEDSDYPVYFNMQENQTHFGYFLTLKYMVNHISSSSERTDANLDISMAQVLDYYDFVQEHEPLVKKDLENIVKFINQYKYRVYNDEASNIRH